uniref:Soluble inorganic pyrophosphatase 6ic n=1 Tax=Rhizophora mucronata TaxID=61149 RepID=A0A2P2KXB1_RHIMU
MSLVFFANLVKKNKRQMAPTAAMLLLSGHMKSTAPPSFPSPTSSTTSSLGVKVSALKWVSEGNLIFKERFLAQELFKVDPCLAVDGDSAMEKRFQEALQHSCWC